MSQENLFYMSSFAIEGNIIDASWYQIIRWKQTEKNPLGKPHLEAINLLADIFYWYRPKIVRSLDNSDVILEKKFHGDILQRNYGQIEEMLGLTKDEARTALETLEKLEIVKREFRTINNRDMKIANVMFIRFFPENLKKLMENYFKKSIPLSVQTDDPLGSKPLPPRFKPTTNTETSSETSTNTQHAVGVFSKNQSKKTNIYPILDSLDISKNEKESITSSFDEDSVNHAVKWLNNPKTIVNKSKEAALKWACKARPEIPKTEMDIVQENKNYAQKYDGKTKGCAKVDACTSFVEITQLGQYHFCLAYSEKGFKEQFINALRKNGFEILDEML